jgi:hypothetical protein
MRENTKILQQLKSCVGTTLQKECSVYNIQTKNPQAKKLGDRIIKRSSAKFGCSTNLACVCVQTLQADVVDTTEYAVCSIRTDIGTLCAGSGPLTSSIAEPHTPAGSGVARRSTAGCQASV